MSTFPLGNASSRIVPRNGYSGSTSGMVLVKPESSRRRWIERIGPT